jgi:Kef-type K+ transport system membrane component KefB
MTVRLPIIAGQIIGGILLGPSCFDIQHFSIFSI